MRKDVEFAIWCARHTPIDKKRTTWNLLTDERSRDGISAAERFLKGEVTTNELKIAAEAARAVARAATATATATAARAAAWAAARAAEAAKSQADALRSIYVNPFEEL
jgi:hypothetical protein